MILARSARGGVPRRRGELGLLFVAGVVVLLADLLATVERLWPAAGAEPWDAPGLWVAPLVAGRLGTARLVAGGPGVSVTQPRFAPDGALHYLADETGWGNLYREGAGPLAPMARDCGGPDWVFGEASYAFLDDGTLVAAWHEPAGQRLGVLRGAALEPVETPFTAFSSLHGYGDRLACIAASAREPSAVVLLDLVGGGHEVLRRSRAVPLPPEAIAVPKPFDFEARDGEAAHGLYYPPASATHVGPPEDRPPLVVVIHGGPTGAARRELSLAVQQWTSRGFAVADVDYRGSTGYGRAYRERLRGAWGAADVDDCADAAAHLAAEGLADSARIVIRGSSAGGMTVLNCLAHHGDVFAAGASLYGVADLAALATDTHKFEARYLDGLVGPWPEAAATYAARSPLRHAGEIRRLSNGRIGPDHHRGRHHRVRIAPHAAVLVRRGLVPRPLTGTTDVRLTRPFRACASLVHLISTRTPVA